MNTPPERLMIAVDQSEILAIKDELRALRQMIEGATITPRPTWITVAEYAARMGKTTKTIRTWVNQGRLDTRRSGNTLMIKAE